MPQYGVLVYASAPADPMALTPDHLEQLEHYPVEARRLGGKVLGGSYFPAQRGFAFDPSTTARSVLGGKVRDGTLVESDLVVTAFFVLSAPDMDVAVRVAGAHPAAAGGGVEVRPMFVPAGT